MRGNDLSNRQAPCVAFRVEGLLISPKKGPIRSALKIFRGDYSIYTVRDDILPVVDALKYIHRKTDWTFLLVSNAPTDRDRSHVEKLLSFIPGGANILYITKEVEIPIRLNAGDFVYYVDANEERRSLMNNRYCVPFDVFHQKMRGF